MTTNTTIDFAGMAIGQVVRIPAMHELPDTPPAQLVEIISKPAKCHSLTCEAWDVETVDVETGVRRPYHRPPAFHVQLFPTATSSVQEVSL